MENARFDDRVQWAVRVRRTPEIPWDHATLWKFRAQALARDLRRQRLRDTLQEASAAGLLGDEGDVTDRFRIAGAAARQGTWMLFVGAMRRVLVEAEAAERRPLALRRSDSRGRKKPAIDGGSEAARQALLQDLVDRFLIRWISSAAENPREGDPPMAAPRTKPPWVLTPEDRAWLERLAHSRTAPPQAVERAQILLAYADGASI